MSRTCPLLFLPLLLLPTTAFADDLSGTYALEGSPWFGGAAFSAELTLEADGDDYRVTHTFADGGQLSGEGQTYNSGRSLWVRFDTQVGATGVLDTLHTDGDGGIPDRFRASYSFRDNGETVVGWLDLGDSAGWSWLRERGQRLDGAVDLTDEALEIPDRATFETLSKRDNVPGAMGVREVKFLVTGVDTPTPVVHFMNTNTHEFHYYFARDALGVTLSNAEFNARTYFTDNRSFIAGSIIAHDNYEHPVTGLGIYTVEFWPTDPLKVDHVEIAYDGVVGAMPFASDTLYYHPAGETQKRLYQQEKTEFDLRDIPVIATQDLFANVSYSPLNLGETYGILRLVDGSNPRPATVRDVVIFVTLPNDLTHVAGVISEAPQTPLSHVNLKAKQNNTPNAFVKNASQVPEIAALIDQPVRYVVTPDGYVLEPATQAEVDAFLDSVRPQNPQTPVRDLSVTDVRPLGVLGNGDIPSVGAKAANLAELRRILPAGMAPEGFAVPFEFYDRFMRVNGLYDVARAMIADPAFQSDPAVREEQLRLFRRQIRRAPLPQDMSDALEQIQNAFGGVPIRARSSTNNEDLEGFNGAGLYDSRTHRPGEGHLENTVKQVWRSLWNYRAFEEREWYRIDHFEAAMGVLLHKNFDDELANGVAVTKNIYDPNWPGFYVNVQVGESLVTNPDPGATPDELLISAIGPQNEYETQYVQRSSLLPAGQHTVMSSAQLNTLVQQMERIQSHFARVYNRENDPTFAMDIEFKTDANGQLIIKQARPWVD